MVLKATNILFLLCACLNAHRISAATATLTLGADNAVVPSADMRLGQVLNGTSNLVIKFKTTTAAADNPGVGDYIEIKLNAKFFSLPVTNAALTAITANEVNVTGSVIAATPTTMQISYTAGTPDVYTLKLIGAAAIWNDADATGQETTVTLKSFLTPVGCGSKADPMITEISTKVADAGADALATNADQYYINTTNNLLDYCLGLYSEDKFSSVSEASLSSTVASTYAAITAGSTLKIIFKTTGANMGNLAMDPDIANVNHYTFRITGVSGCPAVAGIKWYLNQNDASDASAFTTPLADNATTRNCITTADGILIQVIPLTTAFTLTSGTYQKVEVFTSTTNIYVDDCRTLGVVVTDMRPGGASVADNPTSRAVAACATSNSQSFGVSVSCGTCQTCQTCAANVACPAAPACPACPAASR